MNKSRLVPVARFNHLLKGKSFMVVLVRLLFFSYFVSASLNSHCSEKKPLFSNNTEIVTYQSYQSKLAHDCRMFPKTFKWFEDFWKRGRELQVPAASFHHSPWLFEIALVKSLSSLGQEDSLIDVKALPEFMSRGTTESEIHMIKAKIDFLAKESCLQIAFRELVEKNGLEFDHIMQKSFHSVSISVLSAQEFYRILTAIVSRKIFERDKKKLNLKKTVFFLKQRAENLDLYTKQRSYLCRYIEAHLERGALLSGKDYIKRCSRDFEVEDIIDVTRRIRFLVEHYSFTHHRQFAVFIQKKRFDVFYAKALEDLKIDKSKFSLMNKFEISKLDKMNKRLNSLTLWHCSFLFIKDLLIDKLKNRNHSYSVTRYLQNKFYSFDAKDFLESNLKEINQKVNLVLEKIQSDQRFWDEFSFLKNDLKNVLGKNIFHQKGCMTLFAESKVYYIEQLKEYLVRGELKQGESLIFPEATALIAKPFQNLFLQNFIRLERSLESDKPMVSILPQMKTSY